MSEEKCDWCGKTYYNGGYQNWTGGAFKMHNFCSQACCTAFNNSKKSKQEATSNRTTTDARDRVASAQADAIRSQQRQAEEDDFRKKINAITFTGSPESIASDFDNIYQYFINFGSGKKLINIVESSENKVDFSNLKSNKTNRKIIEDKMELGLIALKKVDPEKAEFYEKKIKEENKKRKTSRRIKTTIWVIVGIVFFIIIIASMV